MGRVRRTQPCQSSLVKAALTTGPPRIGSQSFVMVLSREVRIREASSDFQAQVRAMNMTGSKMSERWHNLYEQCSIICVGLSGHARIHGINNHRFDISTYTNRNQHADSAHFLLPAHHLSHLYLSSLISERTVHK